MDRQDQASLPEVKSLSEVNQTGSDQPVQLSSVENAQEFEAEHDLKFVKGGTDNDWWANCNEVEEKMGRSSNQSKMWWSLGY